MATAYLDTLQAAATTLHAANLQLARTAATNDAVISALRGGPGNPARFSDSAEGLPAALLTLCPARPAGPAALASAPAVCATDDVSPSIEIAEGHLRSIARMPLPGDPAEMLVRVSELSIERDVVWSGNDLIFLTEGDVAIAPPGTAIPDWIAAATESGLVSADSMAAAAAEHAAVAVERRVAAGQRSLVIVPTLPIASGLGLRNSPYKGAAVAVLVCLLLYWVIRDIQTKLRSMIAATDEMIAGNYSFRLPPSPIHELNQLGQSVNRLAEQIEIHVGELVSQAFYDSLTGLPNRALLVDRLAHAVARRSADGAGVAVLFLDLDNFKLVNDSLGHAMGDRLLVAVADRLQSCVRPEDTVARLGGDEFTVVLEDVQTVNDAIRVARRIVERLHSPVSLAGRDVFCSASIGIALSLTDGCGTDVLLRNADMAMYRAKGQGKDQYAVFDEEMNRMCQDRLSLETDLRAAVERDEMHVLYQPVVRLDTGTIEQVEALVRWQRCDGQLMSPKDFIPVAEENGLIIPLGQRVLEVASQHVADWRSRFPAAANLSLNVNLSARQLSHRPLVAEVGSVLRSSGLEPSALKLEITESAMMSDAESTISLLRDLRQLGVQLAVDDFGTGYSSLAYLRRFPINILKVDQSFVARLGVDAEDDAIVSAIINLGLTLGLTTIAEGVETVEQARRLSRLGCTLAQGYLYSRPLSAERLEELLYRGGSLAPDADLPQREAA
ncbi:MAG: EAL domain-containing protein [Chloroflexota bacterium]